MNFSGDLKKLFTACDRRGGGTIGRCEFSQLCVSFGIGADDAAAIFANLDRDADGVVNFDDFSLGFNDFLKMQTSSSDPAPSNISNASSTSTGGGGGAAGASATPVANNKRKLLRRQATEKAFWRHLSDRLGESNVRRLLPHSAERLYGLYEEMREMADLPRQVVSGYESLIECLACDATQLEQERDHFDQLLRKHKEQHHKHLGHLEEEMEVQVQRVVKGVGEELEAKFEAEKRAIQAEYELQMGQLEAQLVLLQNCGGDYAAANRQEPAREQLELAEQIERISVENRQLKMSLCDAHTTLALLQTQLAQVRSFYEDKYRLLHSEKEAMADLVDHQQRVQTQLGFMHEANRNLRDNNDSLRANLDSSARRSPIGQAICLSRSVSRQNLCSIIVPETCSSPFPGYRIVDSPCPSGGRHGLFVLDGSEQPTSLQDELIWSTEAPVATDSRYNLEPTGPPDRTFRVVFAGDATVGKTSFITRLHDGIFVANTVTTLGVDFKVKMLRIDERNVAIQLWDTAGQERFRSITQSYFRKADGVLLLFDVTNERSFINVRHWMQSIADGSSKYLPLVLCGTKSDLRAAAEHQGRSCVDPKHADKLAAELEAPYLETSCKSGANVLEALVNLTRKMILNQDVEVQTSGLRLSAMDRSRSSWNCCGKKNNAAK